MLRRILLIVVLLIGGLVAFDFLAPHTAARLGVQLEQKRSGLHEARAAIPGFEIAYLEGGEGEPLVLIHGFGADKNNFTRVARFLTPHYRVLIPDLPGFGDSSKPDNATYTIPEQVERVRAFVQGRGLARVHLGGSSMGGFIAAAYAAKYPAEVASLWLLGSAGTEAAMDSEVRRRYRETGEILLVAKTPEDFRRIADLVMTKPPFIPYSVKRVLAERAIANYRLHSRIFEQIAGPGSPLLESYVTRLETPALVVYGREDRVLNPKGAETFKGLMPNAQVILMDGIGHLPMIEAAQQTAADYLAFRQARSAHGS